MKKLFKNKIFKIILAIALSVCVLGTSAIFLVSSHVVSSTRDRIVTAGDATALGDFDCVIVLGCLVYEDGTLSGRLNDRMEVGVATYFVLKDAGRNAKLIVSGDHGSEDYNEVDAMKSYAVENGVPTEDVFMDHAGFSTYESIYRAKEIFGAERIVIVTQEYHLYRALYIAESLGVEAYGVSADLREYSQMLKHNVREVLARNKDFFTSIFKPKPTYLGEKIDLDGDGNVTND